MDLSGLVAEIQFQTSRSGGKGGQNVNKVETAVTGSLAINNSNVLTEEQKSLLKEKLSNRINKESILQVRSQIHRTQLANKDEVIKRIVELVTRALEKKKARIATKASKASKEKRLESKKQKSELKSSRQRIFRL